MCPPARSASEAQRRPSDAVEPRAELGNDDDDRTDLGPVPHQDRVRGELPNAAAGQALAQLVLGLQRPAALCRDLVETDVVAARRPGEPDHEPHADVRTLAG